MSVAFHERLSTLRLKKLALFALSISALAGCNATSGAIAANSNSAIPAVATPSTDATTPASPDAQKSPALLPTTGTATSTPSNLPAPVGSSSPASSTIISATPQPIKTPVSALPTLAPTARPTIAPTTRPTLAPQPTITPSQSIPTSASGSYGSFISGGLTSGSASDTCTHTGSGTVGTSYIYLNTQGNITNTTYTAGPGSNWIAATYVADQSTPAPTPSFSPLLEPTPNPSLTPIVVPTASSYYVQNVYSGSYSFPNTAPACFIMFSSASGANIIPGEQDNTIGSGFPIPPDGVNEIFGAQGNVTALTITHLSQGSGSGTFQLDNGQSGTITITNFGTITSPQYTFTVQQLQARLRRF